jgi:hypothetical protein
MYNESGGKNEKNFAVYFDRSCCGTDGSPYVGALTADD